MGDDGSRFGACFHTLLLVNYSSESSEDMLLTSLPTKPNGVINMKFGFTPEAEILNARAAMIGFVAAVGSYLTTGQIIPGVW